MKSIYFKTNYNNKLGCDAFVHIDRAPAEPIPSRMLGGTVEIRTADNSYPPVKKRIMALTRFRLGETIDCFSIPSHGLDACDFINWWKHENGETEGAELAIYYYQEALENNVSSSNSPNGQLQKLLFQNHDTD
jgi:hypothetical protein